MSLAFAGAEHDSRVSQTALHAFCERVRATEHAPRGLFQIFERRNGLAEIVERGAGVIIERLRVISPHPEHKVIMLLENASRHGNRFAHQ